ncbi:MAG: gliding motility-associated C-terminal domain-containing protein, partial [Flavobacteriales bacterium]|nr:gliding motility-associated C-terminal domain-containing protein [Flavobacteriales bacterium]
TDANGCQIDTTYNMTQPTLLVVTLDSSGSPCGYAKGSSGASPSGGTPGYTYLWSDGQTTKQAINLNSGSITVTVTDANGCTVVQSTTIQQQPSFVITPATTDALCYGSADGTATVTPNGGIAPYQFLWEDGQTGQTATGFAAGSYKVTITDVAGCDSVYSIAVSEPNELLPQAGPDTSVCTQQTIVIGSNAIGGTTPYQYLWNNAQSSTAPLIFVTPNGSEQYEVTVTDANGCVAVDVVNITADLPPTADFDVKWVPSCKGVLGKFTNISIGADHYVWDFGDGHTSSEPEPIHEFTYGTISQVVLSAYSGNCPDTATVYADIKTFDFYNDPQVPNVFSPNGDGYNDVFKVFINGEMEDCTQLTILNRWGVFIYSPPGGQLAWDGHTTAGEKVPEGTYLYIVEMNGMMKAGTVALIKE